MDASHPASRVISTQIEIGAPLDVVRSVLLDFSSYPLWSTFVTSITPTDTLAVGTKLSVRLEPPGGTGMTMTPTVVHLDSTGFGWQGHLANVPGLFDGKHLFLLSSHAGGTRLEHREEFGGLLYTPLMSWLGMKSQTLAGFTAFNSALKTRAELLATTHP